MLHLLSLLLGVSHPPSMAPKVNKPSTMKFRPNQIRGPSAKLYEKAGGVAGVTKLSSTSITTEESGKFTDTTSLISSYNIASQVKPEFMDMDMRLYHWMTKELYPTQWTNLINNQAFDEKTQKLMMCVL